MLAINYQRVYRRSAIIGSFVGNNRKFLSLVQTTGGQFHLQKISHKYATELEEHMSVMMMGLMKYEKTLENLTDEFQSITFLCENLSVFSSPKYQVGQSYSKHDSLKQQ